MFEAPRQGCFGGVLVNVSFAVSWFFRGGFLPCGELVKLFGLVILLRMLLLLVLLFRAGPIFEIGGGFLSSRRLHKMD